MPFLFCIIIYLSGNFFLLFSIIITILLDTWVNFDFFFLINLSIFCFYSCGLNFFNVIVLMLSLGVKKSTLKILFMSFSRFLLICCEMSWHVSYMWTWEGKMRKESRSKTKIWKSWLCVGYLVANRRKWKYL